MTPDDDMRESADPVPQHHARLDDPSSPATSVAREAAERFAIDAAHRRLSSDAPGASAGGGGPHQTSPSLQRARSQLRHADDDVRALESQLREGRAAAGDEPAPEAPARQARGRGGARGRGKGARG